MMLRTVLPGEICEICKQAYPETKTYTSNGHDSIHKRCESCGQYRLTNSAIPKVNALKSYERGLISGWIRNQNSLGIIPVDISTDTVEKISKTAPLSVMERAEALLKEAGSKIQNISDNFRRDDPSFMAASYSVTKEDVIYLLNFLHEQNLVKPTNPKTHNIDWKILPDGYARLDKINKGAASTKGFVAMSFADEHRVTYEDGIQAGVKGAGYDPIRVDRVEHINSINDEIIKQINSSKFIVADFTGHRNGVYFEAGYALGKGIPVFWTCKKDDMPNLHFDIRQFNCIDWETHIDLAKRLQTRLEAVLGTGPRSNSTQ